MRFNSPLTLRRTATNTCLFSAAYGLSGQWEAAARDGQKCVSLNSKFLKGYHRAANALKHTKQYKDAIKIIEKGLIHFQGNADFRKLLGEVG